MRQTVPLAELHSHLWGAITADDYLDFVLSMDGPRDWTGYEDNYEQVYGARPNVEEIVIRAGAGDPSGRQDFRDLYVLGEEDAGDFARFQATGAIKSHGRPVERHRLDSEVLFSLRSMEDQVRQGVHCAEQRNFFRRISITEAEQTITGMLSTFGRAPEGFQTRLVVSLERSDPWYLWDSVQDAALGPLGHGPTGIDFSSNEEGFPPTEKREFFDAVRDFNERHPERALAILYHVGESFPDKSLESAVRWVHEAADMGAHRLGHAISLGIDPGVYGAHQRTEHVSERVAQLDYDLVNEVGLGRQGVRVDKADIQAELMTLRRRPHGDTVTLNYDNDRLDEVRRRQNYAMERIKALDVAIEVCPTSNRLIGGMTDTSQHPVLRFIENDVPFVVSTDDAGIFDVTLAEEIEWVVKAADLGSGAFEEIASRSWRYRSEIITGRETK
jgi:adenosine deaminase